MGDWICETTLYKEQINRVTNTTVNTADIATLLLQINVVKIGYRTCRMGNISLVWGSARLLHKSSKVMSLVFDNYDTECWDSYTPEFS